MNAPCGYSIFVALGPFWHVSPGFNFFVSAAVRFNEPHAKFI